MIRINLLPPEILEKRRTEHWWAYVVFGGMGLAIILAGFWGVMALQVGLKQGALETLQQEEMAKNLQAERFKIFEQKQEDLSKRQQVAKTALDGRINWSRLLSELSLILPSDVWLSQIRGAQGEPVEIQGFAVDNPSDVPDSGHKSIAKMLVRFADLEQLSDVWLTSSQKSEISDGLPAISFMIQASVEQSSTTTTTAPGVPAPPVQTTQ